MIIFISQQKTWDVFGTQCSYSSNIGSDWTIPLLQMYRF